MPPFGWYIWIPYDVRGQRDERRSERAHYRSMCDFHFVFFLQFYIVRCVLDDMGFNMWEIFSFYLCAFFLRAVTPTPLLYCFCTHNMLAALTNDSFFLSHIIQLDSTNNK